MATKNIELFKIREHRFVSNQIWSSQRMIDDETITYLDIAYFSEDGGFTASGKTKEFVIFHRIQESWRKKVFEIGDIRDVEEREPAPEEMKWIVRDRGGARHRPSDW